MSTVREQIENFSGKCDDLLQSQYILASSKINEVLRAIAGAPALVELFERAAKPFDYESAKEQYMLPSPDGAEDRGILVLPTDPSERIAFIFCILVDIDSGTINFDLFLRIFFSEDDRTSVSYAQFLTQVIRPFKATVCRLAMPGDQGASAQASPISQLFQKNRPGDRARDDVFSDILNTLAAEAERLHASSLPRDERNAGAYILNEAFICAKERRESTLKALLLGYEYFVAQTGSDTANMAALLNLIEEL